VRIGLRYVRGLPDQLLDRIDAARAEAPFADLEDFTRRTGAAVDALESLATAGAFTGFGVTRREGLWAAGGLRDARPATLPGIVTGVEAPPLPGMSELESTAADLSATGLSAARHPTEFVRAELTTAGVLTAEQLRSRPDRAVVEVAGVVTHRQQPETAKGVVFLNLEDETGLVNVICTPDVWERHRRVARSASALRVRGQLERQQGVINLVAQRITALPLTPAASLRSRDFH
jgi:error-prone DNA polymerase